MNIPLPIRLLLWPFSVVYGVAARLHAWLYAQGIYSRKHLNAPVVSVGNLTVGGTGKTPMVLWLAEKFLEEHKLVAILRAGQGSYVIVDYARQHRSAIELKQLFRDGTDAVLRKYVAGEECGGDGLAVCR